VVTTNISVKLRLSLVTQHKVKRQVLLLLGELVCSAVHRKRRTRCHVEFSYGNIACLCYGAVLRGCVACTKIYSLFLFRCVSASVVAGAPIELQMPSNDLPKDQISITAYGLKWSSNSDLETKIQVYRERSLQIVFVYV